MEGTRLPKFEHYDEKVAQGMMAAGDKAGGLVEYLGVHLVEFGPGHLRAEMEVRDELKTPFGNLHGGVVSAIVDHVLGCVLYPLMKRGQWAATAEFKLNYLAPVSSGSLVAEASVVSLTRSTAVVRAEVANAGRLAAVAQGTLLIREPKS